MSKTKIKSKKNTQLVDLADIKKCAKNVGVGTLFWICPVLQFYMLQIMQGDITGLFPVAAILNIILYAVIFLFAYMLIKSRFATVITTTTFWFVISTIFYVVQRLRGTALSPHDIYSIRTALSVAGNYNSFKFTKDFFFAILIALFLVCIAILNKKKKFKVSGLKRWGCVLLSAFLLVVTFVSVSRPMSTAYILYLRNGYLQYGTIGCFVGIVRNMFSSEPDGYNAEDVITTLNSYTNEKNDEFLINGKKPNIIFIMNETFSDISVLGDITYNEELTPYLSSATDIKKGSLIVPVLGGSTSNSEFEFITGLSMNFAPTGSIAYTSEIRRDIVSYPRLFNDLGYSTYYMHPYYKEGWNRQLVCRQLGFEHNIFLEDITHNEKWNEIYSNNHPRFSYISDSGNYQILIDQYENRNPDAGFFYFNVTMQNHGGYSDTYTYDGSHQIQVNGLEKDTMLSTYLSAIRSSDAAMQELIQYFDQQDEPTIIVMFGDHQPNDLTMENVLNKVGGDFENDINNVMKRHTTPYYVWNNCGLSFDNLPDTLSLNYLAAAVLNEAGCPLYQYQQFVLDLMQQYPVLSLNGVIDQNGTLSRPQDMDDELFQQYSYLQHFVIYDKKSNTFDWQPYLRSDTNE